MFEKNLTLVPLFDVYASLLTEHQQEMFSLYYNEDYSLSEIAEQTGISRQGVRDSIKKCEDLLKMYEEKLGLLKIYNLVSEVSDRLNTIADNNDKGEELKKLASSLSAILD